MKYLLGLDIGGTNYHARARGERGRDVDLVVPSSGNLHALGAEGVVKAIDGVVRKLKRQLPARAVFDGVAIGLSGLDDAHSERVVHRALVMRAWWSGADPNRRVLVNDINIGLRAGTRAASAIALVCGTGVNGYAIDDSGAEAWASGRGMRMSDEGGGAWIGVECLRAVRRAEDRRGRDTALTQLVFERFHVATTAEMMPIIYGDDFGKKDLAALNIIVEETARRGDRVAGAILDTACAELAAIVETLHRRLSFGRAGVDTVLIGGTINKNLELNARFLRYFKRTTWMRPLFLGETPPVEGALRMIESTE